MASELITKNSGLVLPEVPKDAQWDYTKSVGKVGSFVFKWKTLKAEVPEILDELWIAREKLSEQGGDRKSNQWDKSPTDKKTWTDYCQEFGSWDFCPVMPKLLLEVTPRAAHHLAPPRQCLPFPLPLLPRPRFFGGLLQDTRPGPTIGLLLAENCRSLDSNPSKF